MAENAGSIQYTVDIETEKTLAAQKRLDGGFDQMQASMKKTDAEAKKLGGGLTKLAASIGAVVAASTLREMAGLVQKYQEMAERVKMATASQEEFESVQKRLLATANGTYRSLEEAQELYIRTANSLRSMGYSTSQALDVTDSMSFAFVKNATSADRATSAISAFSTSVTTGKVAAMQWQTITTAMPTIIEDIAAASGKTSAQIRALGAAGKLTAKDLTEGLRKSLESNSEAAANMASNLTDAGVRTRTAITSVLVSLESQTGVLQSITNGIISAADAMLQFGGDAEKMAEFLNTATTAATALAVVLGARLLAAVTGYTAALVKQGMATVAVTRAADANLRLAQAEATAAANALMQARAAEQAAIGLTTHKAAVDALAVAQGRAATATAAFTAAQTTANTVTRVGTTLLGGLRTAMGFLGGPAGVIFLAAGALAAFAVSSTEAKPPVDLLTESINDLGDAALRLQKIQIADKLEELKGLGATAATSSAQVETLRKNLAQFPNSAKADDWRRALAEQEAAAEGAGKELAQYEKRLADVNAELERRAKGGAAPAAEPNIVTPSVPGGTSAADKKAARELKAIQDQVDALQLQADTLGMTTAELEIYKLELAGATDAQIRAAQSSLAMVEAFNQQADAEEELRKRQKAFGTDAAATITGTVSPLSGGAFDSQAARYDAEKVAEEKRYADQLERLRQAKQAQVEVIGGYQKLELELAETHAKRLEQIEQAKNQVLLSSGQSLFGSLADATRNFAGENSALYKTMFAASKAFSIAQATMAISTGIAQAAANPWPTNLAAMASVASATAGLISDISSVTMSGRANGGPVQAGQMYRVNEGGAPEVYNAANGQQYMLPNQRGQVVSNADAVGGGTGITNIVTITVGADGNSTVDSGTSNADSVALARTIEAVVVDTLERQSRQGGILWSMRNGSV